MIVPPPAAASRPEAAGDAGAAFPDHNITINILPILHVASSSTIVLLY